MKTVRLFFRYLRSRRVVLAAFLLFAALFAVSFRLYHLPVKAVWYPAALCLILGLGLLILDFRAVRARHETLQILLRQLPVLPQELPAAPEIAEEDYAALTAALCSQQRELLHRRRHGNGKPVSGRPAHLLRHRRLYLYRRRRHGRCRLRRRSIHRRSHEEGKSAGSQSLSRSCLRCVLVRALGSPSGRAVAAGD